MRIPNEISVMIYHSPAGDLCIGEYEAAICLCDWASDRLPRPQTLHGLQRELGNDLVLRDRTTPLLQEASKQLDEYFLGKRRSFSLPLRMIGTPFRRRVWENIAQIGYGEVRAYSSLLSENGESQAARAVGSAVGANPMSILIPCHRIVRKSAIGLKHTHPSLHSGYAGGIPAKCFLLELEEKCAFGRSLKIRNFVKTSIIDQ